MYNLMVIVIQTINIINTIYINNNLMNSIRVVFNFGKK